MKLTVSDSFPSTDSTVHVYSSHLRLTATIRLVAPVVVLATCTKPELLHHSLRRPDRLDTEVEIPVPAASDR